MKKKELFEGTARYLRIGSRGDRHKLVIDNLRLSGWVKNEIEYSRAKHSVNSNNPVLTPQDFIRNKQIEVRLM